MPQVLKMKDKSDDFTVDKGLLPKLPFRGIICGKSGSGKTSALGSMLLLPEFYLHNFNGANIHIFSPLLNDNKMETIIKVKEIPDGNISMDFDDALLGMVYDKLVEDFEHDMISGIIPEHKLIILDDLSFSGAFTSGRFNNVSRVFCNGRKQNISIILTTQLYTHILPVCRENASFLIMYNTSLKQLESVAEEWNYLSTKKAFIKMFRENVIEKHDFICINHSNTANNMYLNKNFEVIQK